MSGNGSASANLMAVGCNGALGLQQRRSAKIFDSRGFASFEVCFKNGRGLSLLQRISFVVLRIRVLVGSDRRAGILDSLDPICMNLRPLAKQKRIVAKGDALMALADTFEQKLDDSRAAAELMAA